ncbi:uncharacterized protein LOC133145446 [Syngnathus typhle]|uniref:uncharacterized protein LOC133145446 n=1 Tax=Syngnathus typhle TaxID=161592 RepID=UPI002A69B321|nr:uncharacterized protein LOC133145446 [Syngnathus typhle]
MDFMYIIFVPFACAFDPYSFTRNTTELKFTYNNSINVTGNIFEMFVLIGCPLLLTCMCIERYLAVVQPVLYLKMRKREYYMGVSSVVWIITFVFCLASGIINDLSVMLPPVCIVVCCLFFIMFASLMGVVLSLRQQSPACTSGNKTISPLKRQAVGNVLNVAIPAVFVYTPVCVMVPCLFLTTYGPLKLNQMLCYAFQLCQMFPKYGVLIGPSFYLAKYKQIFCGTAKTSRAQRSRS